MFQLYKKRGFSDFLNDTFGFLKLSGRHFFKNYAIVCGGLLLVLTALGYIVFKAYWEFFNSALNGNTSFANLFGDNIVMIGTVFVLFFVVLILLSIVSYLYPIVYLRLYDENGNFDFTTNQIIDKIKSNCWRSVKFSLLTLLFSILVGFIILALLLLLCVTIIGIPFAVIGVFALSGIYNVAFYLYINDHRIGYMDSFKIAFEFVKNNLWPVVGANFAMLMLISIVGSVTSLIPMIIGMVGFGTGFGTVPGAEESTTMLIILGVSYGVSLLVQFILNNLIILSNGMIYYSMLEVNHSHNTKSEIDLIGTESEE